MSPASGAVEPSPLQNLSGCEQLFPKKTACCIHGCNPVDMLTNTIGTPRRRDMKWVWDGCCRPFSSNDVAGSDSIDLRPESIS